jgi:hypothetical protein
VPLGAALVDRARVVGRKAAGRKVAGRTIYSTVSSEWFKARLTLSAPAERTDEATGVMPATHSPTLLLGVRDMAGDPIELSGNDRIEVASRELGTALYDVVGGAAPLRKKRRVIGYEVALRLVVVPESEPVRGV